MKRSRCAIAVVWAVLAPWGCGGEIWRATVPKFSVEWPEIPPSAITQERLPNGLSLFVVEQPASATVSIAILSRAGALADPLGKEGLASLAWSTMLHGAGGIDESGIAAQFARIGASPSVNVSERGAGIGVTVLPADTARAMELLAQVVCRPAFETAVFDRDRERRDAVLVQAENLPMTLAQRAFLPLVFGAGHPAVRRAAGTRESVNGLRVEDARELHRIWIAPNTTALVVSGNVTVEQARAITISTFGAWAGSAAPPPEPPNPVTQLRLEPVTIARPGLNQTLMLFGAAGPRAGTDEQAALDVATTVVSGLLFKSLREKLGLTYSVKLSSLATPGSSLLSGSAWVRGDGVDKAMQVTLDTLRVVHRFFSEPRPATQSVMASVKLSILRQTLQKYDGVEGAQMEAGERFFDRLPEGWQATYARRIREVTPEQIERVVDRYLDPRRLQIVLVGDPRFLGAQASEPSRPQR